jgi:hypothetical protein
MFKNRYKYISTTLKMQPGMSSTPTDSGDLRRSMALKTSESETGAKDKNLEDDESVRKTIGQGFS